VYATSETHTWLHKATDLLGLGTDCIRWIPPDRRGRADPAALRRLIDADRAAGDVPVVVVGTAGTVSTGAIDPLDELAEICRQEAVWFHVDAAYGGFAAALPDAPPALRALGRADSVAVDPHKWLYVPLEAGCALVRDPAALRGAFSYSPPYYRFTSNSGPHGPPLNYYAFGPQNSRGHRALKVWLALRQGGRTGYVRAIAEDILLARALHDLAVADPELEAWTNSLSITTLRYVPTDVDPRAPGAPAYLDRLNEALLDRLQAGGEAYLSNAVVGGTFLLRACVVNFRTTLADIEALATLVVRLGRELDAELRPEAV
jgi:aromatic-L-amino-acid/L-tryptophan decarboxylase